MEGKGKFLYHFNKNKDVYESDLGWQNNQAEEESGLEDLEYYLLFIKYNLSFIYKGQMYSIDCRFFETKNPQFLWDEKTEWWVPNPSFDPSRPLWETEPRWRLCKHKLNPNWDGKYMEDKFDFDSAEYIYFGNNDREFYETAHIDGVPIVEVMHKSYIFLYG